MVFVKPPRGYRQAEYPLPHKFEYQFPLSAEGTTKDSTIVPLLRYSEKAFAPENQFANWTHGSFEQETGVTCTPNSIIPRINIKIMASLTKAAIATDAIRRLKFMWMPIYTSFIEGLNAQDTKTATAVKTILSLETENTNHTTQPIFSAVSLGGSIMPLSNVNDDDEAATTDWGLASTPLESVAFDYDTFMNAKRFFSNGPMMKTMLGPMRIGTVGLDSYYIYKSNNFTNPKVKRMNEHTFCGILFHLFQSGDADQFTEAADTTAIGHINFNVQCQYDEWNSEYNQAGF